MTIPTFPASLSVPTFHIGADWHRIGNLATFAVAWWAFAWALLGAWLNRVPFQDSAAYWRAWHGPLYQPAFGLEVPHFVYSPVAALAVWPLAQLSLAAFVVLWAALGVAAYVWLLWPLPWPTRLPALAAGVLFALNGNIEWLLALVAVFGMRAPSLWLVGLFTKVTPFLGFGWFIFRRDVRAATACSALVVALVVVAAILLPEAWSTWFGMLVAFGEPSGSPLMPAPPLTVRMVLALALLAWGARTDRPAVLAGVLFLAQPDLQPWAFGFLAAVPRLAQARVPQNSTSPRTR